MTEQDVRDMLRRRAADVQPSADALERIRARVATDAPVRGRRGGWLAAAAAIVVAMVALALVAERDDETAVVSGITTTTGVSGGDAARYLEAVWPTADPEELRGISADHLRQQYPWAAASAYLLERLGVVVDEDGFTLESGDATHAVLRVADGSVDAAIEMQRIGTADDPLWYVVRASSAFVDAMGAYDGHDVTGDVTIGGPGDLTVEVEPADSSDPVISIPRGAVEPGDKVPIDERLPDEPAVVVRAMLRTDDGGVAMSDLPVPLVGWAPAPGGEVEQPLGVWPWPGDAVDRLEDPVDTAMAYIQARLPDGGEVVADEFREGDSNSGEVVLTGDVTSTVLVRRVGERWHVEAAISDLIATEVYEDGSVLARTTAAGQFGQTVHHPEGRDHEVAVLTPVPAGHEVTASVGPPDAVVAHAFQLRTADTIGWTEVRVVNPEDAVD